VTRIVGYTRKKEPRWFSVLLTAGIVVFIVVVFLAVTFSINWTTELVKMRKTATTTTKAIPTTVAAPLVVKVQAEEKVVSGGEVKVEKIVFSSGITGNLPVDNLEKLSSGGRIYCYSRLVAAEVPRTIYHVWVGPEGDVAAEIKLTISRIPSDLWSYINLGGFSPGEWEMRIKDESGALLARKTFTVY